jgi:hypothetical protein
MSDTPRPAKRVLKKAAPPRVPPPPAETTLADPSDEDDDDVARPSTPSKRVRAGWSAGQETMDSTSQYAQALKLEEKSQIIKFLEDAPYASFRRHWVDSLNQERKKITRAYTCPITFGDPCPLCEIGDKPQAVSAFNVAICGDDGEVIRKSWDVGARLFNTLKSYNGDPKIGPLTRGYFLVSRSGKGGTTQYNVSPIRESALEEDYDTPIPDPDSLKRLELYTNEIIDVLPLRKLRELADELAAEDD